MSSVLLLSRDLFFSSKVTGTADAVGVKVEVVGNAEAALLANTYARSALSLHATLLSREATSEVNQLQAREKALPAGESSALTQLGTEISTLSSVANGHDPNFSLLQTAQLPTSATGTSKKLIVVLALLAGLVIGVGAATAIEYLNRQDNEVVEIDLPDPGKNPEEKWQSREMEIILREEVGKLGVVCRRAIEMCVLDEHPQLPAARSLNLSVATMKSRVFRGKRLLGRALSRRLGARHGGLAMAAEHRVSCEM